MTATLARPAWSKFGIETFDKPIAQHAPHVPTRSTEPRKRNVFQKE